MTRFYLKLSIPIALTCLTFALTARALGTTQPPNPALRGFIEGCDDKPQPCWYGIVPGVTTWEELNPLLLGMNYVRDESGIYFSESAAICVVEIMVSAPNSNIVSRLILSFCSVLWIGDVNPFASYVITWIAPNCNTYNMGEPEHRWQLNANGIKPYTLVNYFILSESLDHSIRIPENWLGFAPAWKYGFEKCYP